MGLLAEEQQLISTEYISLTSLDVQTSAELIKEQIEGKKSLSLHSSLPFMRLARARMEPKC